MRMKYRLLLPATYALLESLFFVVFLKGLGGHGPNPFGFVVYLIYPACFLLDMFPASWGPKDDLVLILLCVITGLVQYALMGYVIDRFLTRRRRRKLAP